jgi:Domain of unknown function (DUF4908)
MKPISNSFLAIAACVALALAAGNAPAQDSIAQRLSMDRLANIQPGTYLAGDRVKFTLDAAGDDFLLRFEGSPEVFVLYADHASLGGRVLKFDSGETAIQVAVWGGLTLYTDAQPAGLPAVRTGDSIPPAPLSLGLSDLQNAAVDEAQHLAYTRRLQLGFTADWNSLGDGPARSYAYDAMENAARGLDRFAASAQGRDALAHRVIAIAIAPTGGRPMLQLSGHTLVVTFNPGRGFAGRASSRAIARSLPAVLGAAQKH